MGLWNKMKAKAKSGMKSVRSMRDNLDKYREENYKRQMKQMDTKTALMQKRNKLMKERARFESHKAQRRQAASKSMDALFGSGFGSPKAARRVSKRKKSKPKGRSITISY